MITSIKGINPNMIANNLEPFRPTHPGEVLKDELEYRKISQRQLAAEMGISYTLLNEVLNGKRQVNTELALLVEAALDIPAESLLQMQARYNMLTAKRNKSFMEKLQNVRKIVACRMSVRLSPHFNCRPFTIYRKSSDLISDEIELEDFSFMCHDGAADCRLPIPRQLESRHIKARIAAEKSRE